MKILFSAKGFEVTSDLEKYANRKVSKLAKRIAYKGRDLAECNVFFKKVMRKGTKFNTCEISLKTEENEFKAKETTQHMYAALDIAVVQIEQQLRDEVSRRGKGNLLKRHFKIY